MSDLERSAENRFGERLARWAYEKGYEVTYLKLNVAGYRGWPDRLLLWPFQRALFIEWKAVGKEARPLQEHVHNLIRAMGFEVRVYQDDRIALEEVKDLIAATAGTSPWDEAGGRR